MKVVLYYAAVNSVGTSSNIVNRLKEKLNFYVEYRNVVESVDEAEFANYDLIIFLIATYGDQELQENIENFLISIKHDFTGKKFAICELGNYYGYDDFTFGSGFIVENYLLEKNGSQLLPLASIDTLPLLDWKAV